MFTVRVFEDACAESAACLPDGDYGGRAHLWVVRLHGSQRDCGQARVNAAPWRREMKGRAES